MRRTIRLIALFISLAALATLASAPAFAQRRHPPTASRVEPRPAVRRGAVVFIGGYFYDPFFGPYPWWPRAAYPYPYYPVYQSRAVLRVLATPEDAAVYVDGFYAGVVDDFNGFFQGLPLPPGGHQIELYLDGYRTVHRPIYLAPGATLKLSAAMERTQISEASEPPTLAPPLPRPPEGSFIPPRTAPRTPPRLRTPDAEESAAIGTLSLYFQPSNAEVWIDGERWLSSNGQQLVVQLTDGPHRLEIVRTGYLPYSGQIWIADGETTAVGVSLMSDR